MSIRSRAADFSNLLGTSLGMIPGADHVTRADFVRRVTLQLNDLQRKGKVEKIGGRAMRWRMAD